MLQSQNRDFVYDGEDMSPDGQVGPNTVNPYTGKPLGDGYTAINERIKELFQKERMTYEEAFNTAVERD
jgi:hypothetical protein